MAKYNVENGQVEIHTKRLFKYSPELVYNTWTDINLLKRWFMTSQRISKLFNADIHEGGQYRIVDARNGKQSVVQGKYEELVSDEYIRMTIGMPELSDSQGVIEVKFEEREPGSTQMFFYYQSIVEEGHRLTALEHRHEKREYYGSTAYGLELVFDRIDEVLDRYVKNNDMLL